MNYTFQPLPDNAAELRIRGGTTDDPPRVIGNLLRHGLVCIESRAFRVVPNDDKVVEIPVSVESKILQVPVAGLPVGSTYEINVTNRETSGPGQGLAVFMHSFDGIGPENVPTKEGPDGQLHSQLIAVLPRGETLRGVVEVVESSASKDARFSVAMRAVVLKDREDPTDPGYVLRFDARFGHEPRTVIAEAARHQMTRLDAIVSEIEDGAVSVEGRESGYVSYILRIRDVSYGHAEAISVYLQTEDGCFDCGYDIDDASTLTMRAILSDPVTPHAIVEKCVARIKSELRRVVDATSA